MKKYYHKYSTRHDICFIDEALSSRAYEDTALPIGKSQTISQPYIVARMTEALLEHGPLENVLEVGTGFWLSDSDFCRHSYVAFIPLSELKACYLKHAHAFISCV